MQVAKKYGRENKRKALFVHFKKGSICKVKIIYKKHILEKSV
jgi:hypothetical protein